MQYANVIVDISASEVDRLFSYAVPGRVIPASRASGIGTLRPPESWQGFVVSLSRYHKGAAGKDSQRAGAGGVRSR